MGRFTGTMTMIVMILVNIDYVMSSIAHMTVYRSFQDYVVLVVERHENLCVEKETN